MNEITTLVFASSVLLIVIAWSVTYVYVISNYSKLKKEFSTTLNTVSLRLTKLRELSETLDREEFKILQEKTFIKDILDSAKIFIVVLDIDANILCTNKYFNIKTGYDERELIGKNWFSIFIDTEVVENSLKEFNKCICNSPKDINNYILTRDNKKIYVSWKTKRLRDSSGEIIGLIVAGVPT